MAGTPNVTVPEEPLSAISPKGDIALDVTPRRGITIDDAKEKIRALRKQTGKSQSKFAQYFHIPVRTLQSWESRSEPNRPSEGILWMIERILELESMILEGRGE